MKLSKCEISIFKSNIKSEKNFFIMIIQIFWRNNNNIFIFLFYILYKNIKILKKNGLKMKIKILYLKISSS